MKYHELPTKHKRTAIAWAVDIINEWYEQNDVDLVDESSPEVQQYLEDQEYEIKLFNNSEQLIRL